MNSPSPIKIDDSFAMTPSSEDVNSSQHIRDLKLAIEYKHCGKNAPGGVFLVPEMDSLRSFNGVIFVRRGLYRNGIFRFSMRLPEPYNSINTHPEIVFNPPVFNPFIDPKTGVLDLRLNPLLKEWHPEKHFITTALTFIKKIFYMKSYDEYGTLPNEEAQSLFAADKEQFLAQVNKTIESSLHGVYSAQPSACNMLFTEPKPAHDVIREKILAPMLTGEDETSPHKLTDGLETSGDEISHNFKTSSRSIESENEE